MSRFKIDNILPKLIFSILLFAVISLTLHFVFKNYLVKKENSNIEDKSSEVLAAVTPITPQKISKYNHKNNIREECSSVQSSFSNTCQSIVNKGQIVNMPEKVWYANPVLEEMLGEPIIFNYGGVYQINRSTVENSSVSLISRLYDSPNNRYTGACSTGKYPSTVLKSGNLILWGSGGNQSDQVFRCMNDNPGYTLEECNKYAKMFGIPIINKFTSGDFAGKECIQREGFFCYDKQFDCRMLNGDSEYWNGGKVYRTKFSKNSSGELEMSLDNAYRTPGHPGYAIRYDAYKICQGKKRNGSCDNVAAVVLELPYPATNKDAIFMRSVDDPNEKGNIKKAEGFNAWAPGNYLKDSWKSFYLRSFYGDEEKYQSFGPYFSGSETPYDSFKDGVDHLAYSEWSRNKTQYLVLKYQLNNYGLGTKSYELQDKKNFDPNFYNEFKFSDYSSERYWITVWYNGKFLYVTRFKPTGLNQNQYMQMNTLSMPASFSFVKFYSTMPNVTFGITSNDDLDILIAPQYNLMLKNSTIQSRVFRAEKFNAPINEPFGKLTELTDLTANPQGYKFDNPEPGNNNPISMRYYKTDDNDPNNDYAVFASKNYVFTSLIPSTVKCSIDETFNLINTHPSSNNFGVVPNNITSTSSSFNLNFSFMNPPKFKCDGKEISLGAGAVFKINLYDGIDSSISLGSFTGTLQNDLKTLIFNNIVNKNYSKFNYSLSIDYNSSNYLINNELKYFTLENFLTLNTFNDDVSTTPFGGAKLVITKKLTSSDIQYNLTQLSSDVSKFSINSNQFNNFYFDHNLKKVSNSLIDDYTYSICFTNSVDLAINKIGLNPNLTSSSQVSNDFLTATVKSNCLEIRYKNPNTSGYNMFPQQLFVYLNKPQSIGPSNPGYKNFRVNGNVMIKNLPEAKMQINPDADKKYQGIYISSADKSEKYQKVNPTTLNLEYRIPYYLNLTKSLNFQITSNLVNFNPVTSNTEFLYQLLTDEKPNLNSKDFDEIDAYSTLNGNTKPRIIYVAKNKRIIFDLNNSNILKLLSNLYFVSTDKNNVSERIQFKIDCNNSNYSSICSGGSVVHLKGGFYGDIKLIGNLNSQINDKDFIVLNQNPEILILVQNDLKQNKIFNVTRSKTIFKYLE